MDDCLDFLKNKKIWHKYAVNMFLRTIYPSEAFILGKGKKKRFLGFLN